MSRKTLFTFEGADLAVIHRSSNGRAQPEKVIVVAVDHRGREEQITLTVDQLFDLTDVLDDICDSIEDRSAKEVS